MDVGMMVMFQSDDYLKADTDGPFGLSDQAVYAREKTLARLAEPLGFDSLWSVEHHFTGYTMCPDVLQFLAYMAGQTTHIRLGTAVVVLPWHNPVRVADAVAMLDNLCEGRFTFGIGRGLGRTEFEGMGVPMSESRTRFVEAAEMVLGGLEQGFVEYDGTHYQQPKRWLRPSPTRSFRGRTYAAAVSPESLRIMARLGVGLLIVPQKPWETIISEVTEYREIFQEVNGVPAPDPVVNMQVFCDRDPVRASEMGRAYSMDYYASVLKHYEMAGTHFATTKGYEHYAQQSEALNKVSTEHAQAWYADLQCIGTPEQCVEKIAYVREQIGCSEFMGIFSFSGMAQEEAERNIRLFASDVKPRLKDFGRRTVPTPGTDTLLPSGF